MTKKQLPYGTWPSELTAEMVAGKTTRLMETSINQNRFFWLETRPHEKGRVAIMMQEKGETRCILPHPLSAKSKVHEYGGGAYCVNGSIIYFVLADNQQIYFADFTRPTFEPKPLTSQLNLRFADLQFDVTRNQIIAVCEDHSDPAQEPTNTIVAVDAKQINPIKILHQGYDFYSSPRVSPNGEHLVWNCWNHPNMPWDCSELWLGAFSNDGNISESVRLNPGIHESIFQPQWAPNNDLFFVSDRDNWWNIYRYTNNTITQVTSLHAEFATPQWTFNMSTYGFLDSSTLFATYSQNGIWQLCQIDVNSNKLTPIESECVNVFGVSAENNVALFLGSTPTTQTNIYQYAQKKIQPINKSQLALNTNEISIATPVTFKTKKDSHAYAFYYPPKNTCYKSSGAPPIIVICHGGPTGSANIGLELKVQFWTNRGFSVLDVNYRGSTGYGRKYRQSLHNNWGVFDIEDVCSATNFAIDNQLAHKNQCIIKGSSAGGYTVLSALTFTDTFHAGVSLYGIGDLNILIDDTHKFEARYLDSLVGDYKTYSQNYFDRSPIHFTERLNCPNFNFSRKGRQSCATQSGKTYGGCSG